MALHVFWADLAEIRCLAVAEHVQGLGIGRRLVDACWELARELEIKSIFALTSSTGFFERCGYQQIEKIRAASGGLERMRSLSVVSELPGNRADSIGRPRGECSSTRRRGWRPPRIDGGSSVSDRVTTRPGARGAAHSNDRPRVVGMLRARIEAHLVGVGVSFLTAWLMLLTEPRMAIAWDEGYTLGREESLRDWFRALRDPPRFAATLAASTTG